MASHHTSEVCPWLSQSPLTTLPTSWEASQLYLAGSSFLSVTLASCLIMTTEAMALVTVTLMGLYFWRMLALEISRSSSLVSKTPEIHRKQKHWLVYVNLFAFLRLLILARGGQVLTQVWDRDHLATLWRSKVAPWCLQFCLTLILLFASAGQMLISGLSRNKLDLWNLLSLAAGFGQVWRPWCFLSDLN